MLHPLAATADPPVARLAELMRSRQPVVALTGAGTASGSRDFRAATGCWARFDPQLYSGVLAAVVTQNIDMLHAKAGSREATEVRGDLRLDGDAATALTAIAALLCA